MKYFKIIILVSFLLLSSSKLSYAAGRYISLAPESTEILFALGLADELIGVSSYCNYPQQAADKPKVGSFSVPDIEKILYLKPDYIFCTGLEQARAVAELKRLGLNVYVSHPSNIEELFTSIKDIGKITGKNEEAAALIGKMSKEIAEITSKTGKIPVERRKKVFVEIWHDPLMTAGKGTLLDEMISLAGGVNIAHQVNRPYTVFSQEGVINANPDCMILAYMDQEAPLKLVEQRFGWSGIAAVKNKCVFNDIDPDMLLRAGPRASKGIKELYKKFYE